MTPDDDLRRKLAWCLGLVSAVLLVASLQSNTWMVMEGYDDPGWELHVGLWREEVCSDRTCLDVPERDHVETPAAGVLGLVVLVFGALTAIGLGAQLFHVTTRAAMFVGAAGVAVATAMVYRDDTWVPGPAYVTFVIAAVAAIVAAALAPPPLPRGIPPRPEA